MLKGKKCPRLGITVITKGSLVGITTGNCEARRVEVRVPGVGVAAFARGELTKAGTRQQKRYAADMARMVAVRAPRRPRPAVMPASTGIDMQSLPLERYSTRSESGSDSLEPGSHTASHMYGYDD